MFGIRYSKSKSKTTVTSSKKETVNEAAGISEGTTELQSPVALTGLRNFDIIGDISEKMKCVSIEAVRKTVKVEGKFNGEDKKTEENMGGIPYGFLKPDDVILGMTSFILEGEIHRCFATGIYSPSEMYLVFAKDFPGQVDELISRMSSTYNDWGRGPGRAIRIAKSNMIKPGMFVGVYKQDENDWFRGLVLKQTSNHPVNKYLIQLVDLGEYHEFRCGDIVYLHEAYAEQPLWAIPCRLALSKHYDNFHEGHQTWNGTVISNLRSFLFNQSFYAKFLRRVSQKGELIWEISMLGFKDEHPRFHTRGPIQKQLIKISMNEYRDDSGEIENV